MSKDQEWILPGRPTHAYTPGEAQKLEQPASSTSGRIDQLIEPVHVFAV